MTQPRHCEEQSDAATSRDFCYIENVIQINLLAATVEETPASSLRGAEGTVAIQPISPTNQIYNVAVGDRTTLNQL